MSRRKNARKDTPPKCNIFQSDFEDIPITTKTKIVNTNWKIDIVRLFDIYPIIDITPNPEMSTFATLNNGDVVCMKLGKQQRGKEPLKGPTRARKSAASAEEKPAKAAHFLNSLTIVMWVNVPGHDKFVNFKISRNGKFQITGCKRWEHAKNCVSRVWKMLISLSKKQDDNLMKLDTSMYPHPVAVFRTVMINMDFTVGYNVDRKNVDMYVKQHTDYTSIFEVSLGYTGVNVKIPVKEPEDKVYKMLVWPDPLKKPRLKDGTRADFHKLMSTDQIQKDEQQRRHVTLLFFQSGSVIISGPYINELRNAFTWVKGIFKKNKKDFQEDDSQFLQ